MSIRLTPQYNELLVVECLPDEARWRDHAYAVRGVLLPRMAGVFGRWDWVANAVLFGLHHVHKIWFWRSMITSSFGTAWAAKRYRSLWMGVIVHGVEGYFIVLVLGVILGWYPCSHWFGAIIGAHADLRRSNALSSAFRSTGDRLNAGGGLGPAEGVVGDHSRRCRRSARASRACRCAGPRSRAASTTA